MLAGRTSPQWPPGQQWHVPAVCICSCCSARDSTTVRTAGAHQAAGVQVQSAAAQCRVCKCRWRAVVCCCWSQCVPGGTQEGWGGIGKSVYCKVYQQHYTVLLIYTLIHCCCMCANRRDRKIEEGREWMLCVCEKYSCFIVFALLFNISTRCGAN